ncbi:MAG: hypothetical protein Q9173_005331 [Seirophora scorigena]
MATRPSNHNLNEAPRPLLPVPAHGLLPRRLLPRRARGQGQPRRRGRPEQGVPRLQRLTGE